MRALLLAGQKNIIIQFFITILHQRWADFFKEADENKFKNILKKEKIYD